MRHFTFFVMAIFLSLSAIAQVKVEPRVLVLYPSEVVASDEVKAALSDYEREIEVTEEMRRLYVKEGLAENWKVIRSRELEFLSKQDFYGLISYKASTNLIYKLYEYEDYPVVYPVKDVCAGDMESLKQIAQKHDADWVVNIVKLELMENGERVVKAKVQLYNIVSHRVFFNSDFTGSANHAPSDMDCELGSWECAGNNMVASAMEEVFDRLDKYRKYWK